jgi:hypothetical protein
MNIVSIPLLEELVPLELLLLEVEVPLVGAEAAL